LNLILRAGVNNNNFTCSEQNCTIQSPCADFTSFSNLVFRVQFTGQANYVLVPLAAFAVDADQECILFIQELGDDNYTSPVVLGAMFA